MYLHSTTLLFIAIIEPLIHEGLGKSNLLQEAQRFTMDCDGRRIIVETEKDKLEFPNKCGRPQKQTLIKPQIFPTSRMRIATFHEMISAPHLKMCIRVIQSTIVDLDLSFIKSISSTCKGPPLVITENKRMTELKLTREFLENAPPNSIVIRGNPKLQSKYITDYRWFSSRQNLQEYRECAMPAPFWSFKQLAGCASVYGVLFINETTSKILDDDHKIPKLRFTGCIMIHKTVLTNVDFLERFEKFTFVEGRCEHSIDGNRKLCIEDPIKLKRRFEYLEIDQTSNTNCKTLCSGGDVDEEYLQMLSGCEAISGDVIISKWTEIPNHVTNLEHIRRINGTLRIYNTKNLKKFDFFKNLEEVSVPQMREKSAIEIMDNEELETINMPKLKKASSKSKNKIVIVNNAELTITEKDAKLFYSAAGGKEYVILDFNEKFDKRWLLLLLIPALFLIIVAIVASAVYVKTRRKNMLLLPQPPYHLKQKSKVILRNLVQDIVKHNPLVWHYYDRDLLWKFELQDAAMFMHCKKHDYEVEIMIVLADIKLEKLLANNKTFLNSNMLLLAPNGQLSQFDSNVVFERIKSLASKNMCLMIGDDTNPACIIPLLPKDVLKEQTYTYSGNSYSIALLEMKTVGPRTTAYKYSITYMASGGSETVKDKSNKNNDSNTEKIVSVYYYRWDKRIMPHGFEELLQLARLCEPGKSICISNRRKEVFSLIYMFYAYIYVLKEPVKLMDAFRIHTAKCNGSILDRSEMLFVMAIIMEWAYQSRAVPKDLIKKHTEWCRSYALMSLFAKGNKNIKSIHPDHLPNLGSVTEEDFSSIFETVPRFSPRDPCAMKDKYHRAIGKERDRPRKTDAPIDSQDLTKPHSASSHTGKTAVDTKGSALQGWAKSSISAKA